MERIEIHTRLVAAMLSNEKFYGQSYTEILKKAEEITDRILLAQAVYEQDNVHFPERVV
jgi:cytoplasmic iron level regulating protein YaaA (DUF328/UPF0246 family)